MSNDILKYISDRIQEEIDKNSEGIIGGLAKDFGDYKWHVGIVRGLKLANGIIIEAAEKLASGEDEND